MVDNMKIAFDVGGVLSKHEPIRELYRKMLSTPGIEVYVISDMHSTTLINNMLRDNNLSGGMIYSADYAQHGENCKAVLCERLKIDVLIDDFIGYVAKGKHVRLLVMPDPDEPYYSDDWKTDGSEGDFGRRCSKNYGKSTKIQTERSEPCSSSVESQGNDKETK